MKTENLESQDACTCVSCIHFLPTARYEGDTADELCMFYHAHVAAGDTSGISELVHWRNILESIPQTAFNKWGKAWLAEHTATRICGCYEVDTI